MKKRSKMARREAIEGFLCIGPWLIGFLCFTFGAMIFSFYISMTKWDLISPAHFVGLENYKTILTDDFRFQKAIQVTAIYASVAVPMGIMASLAVALLLNLNMRGMRLFRAIFYIPAILPGAATTMVWLWMFKPQGGVINTFLTSLEKLYSRPGVFTLPIFASIVAGLLAFWYLTVSGRTKSTALRVLGSVAAAVISYLLLFMPGHSAFGWPIIALGQNPPKWIYDPNWALPSFMIMSLWAAGSGMIIYLAGLQGVPTQLYEAAEIDGAGSWKKFKTITIPMISPTILFNLIMGIIGSFQVFTSSFIMTPEGGPGYSALFYVLFLYQKAFKYLQMGYAAAMAWILFGVVLVLTLIVLKSSAAWVYYEAEVKK
jgi:multiple sugar transport system permease protein